jgi:hypothetical protein
MSIIYTRSAYLSNQRTVAIEGENFKGIKFQHGFPLEKDVVNWEIGRLVGGRLGDWEIGRLGPGGQMARCSLRWGGWLDGEAGGEGRGN